MPSEFVEFATLCLVHCSKQPNEMITKIVTSIQSMNFHWNSERETDNHLFCFSCIDYQHIAISS